MRQGPKRGDSNRGAGWGALLLYARAEWRSRWRSYLLLAGVAAVAVAAIVATLTAAARSESAFERLRAATHASDISAAFPDAASATTAATSIARMDGVENAGAEAELFVRPKGSDLFPDYNLYARAPLTEPRAIGVNTPVITTGRAVDPERADEMAVSEDLAAKLGVTVGDRVTLESMTRHWVDVAFNGGDPGPPDGPNAKVTVVGLSRSPADFARWDGLLHLGPAFVERYGKQVRTYSRVEIRLSQPESRQAVGRRLNQLAEEVDLRSPLLGTVAATDGGLNAIATALRLIAAIAALAGAVVIALALARAARLGLGDRRALTALGWTTRELVEAAVLVFAPWLLLGVGLGVLGGVLIAPETMVGLARSVDPAPTSIRVDGEVVLGVGLIAAAFGLLVVGLTARRFARARPGRVRPPARVLQLYRPLPIALGVRHAVGGESNRGGRASRGAMVVMAAGVAGAVAALMVSASISWLQTDPALIGQSQAPVIDSGESVDVYDRALPMLEHDKRVAMLAGIHVAFGVSAGRTHNLPMLAYDIRRGHLPVSVVRGRIAAQPDEVALGPATLDRLGKNIGDVVELHHKKKAARYRIVGAVLFPEGDFQHDAGIAITASGANLLVGDIHRAANLHQVLFEWADGVDTRIANRQLGGAGLQVLTNAVALKPASVSNLGEVVTLPRYLAVFLGILSLATFANALFVSVRRRSRELGTLQALGMTRRAGPAVIAVHAFTLVGIAIVVGMPVGLAVGTKIWTRIAESANVIDRAVAPGSWITLYVLATVVAAGVLTAIPAWRALRLRAAGTLRAE